eukprot:Hpha_TRINITY_DN9681_c0_g1::TRINITY_DN9681_c0_g1_i1::g.184410::m.184410
MSNQTTGGSGGGDDSGLTWPMLWLFSGGLGGLLCCCVALYRWYLFPFFSSRGGRTRHFENGVGVDPRTLSADPEKSEPLLIQRIPVAPLSSLEPECGPMLLGGGGRGQLGIRPVIRRGANAGSRSTLDPGFARSRAGTLVSPLMMLPRGTTFGESQFVADKDETKIEVPKFRGPPLRGEEVREWHRRLLLFYGYYCPDKLPEVDVIFARRLLKGRPAMVTLWDKLQAKYGKWPPEELVPEPKSPEPRTKDLLAMNPAEVWMKHPQLYAAFEALQDKGGVLDTGGTTVAWGPQAESFIRAHKSTLLAPPLPIKEEPPPVSWDQALVAPDVQAALPEGVLQLLQEQGLAPMDPGPGAPPVPPGAWPERRQSMPPGFLPDRSRQGTSAPLQSVPYVPSVYVPSVASVTGWPGSPPVAGGGPSPEGAAAAPAAAAPEGAATAEGAAAERAAEERAAADKAAAEQAAAAAKAVAEQAAADKAAAEKAAAEKEAAERAAAEKAATERAAAEKAAADKAAAEKAAADKAAAEKAAAEKAAAEQAKAAAEEAAKQAAEEEKEIEGSREISITKAADEGLGVALVKMHLVGVDAGSIAERSGAMDCLGMRLTHCNGVRVHNLGEVAPHSKGKTNLTLRFAPAEPRESGGLSVVHKAPDQGLGLMLIDMILDGVEPGSPGEIAGCGAHVGQLVTHVNGRAVASLTDVVPLVKEKSVVAVLFGGM